jgi:hypothetical protein
VRGKRPIINARGLGDVAHGLTLAALIVCFLYLAGSIVEPLVIAALLGFILAPVMRRLAESGEHRNYRAIEWELQAFGYPRASHLLDHERVREKLDDMCVEARKGFVSAER